jgi:hypothetical protein
MSYKIVVARYHENIDWLKSEMPNCILYNKGKPLHLENEIRIPNVGRESETYLQYILANYNQLPDVVVFTQARISDHVGGDVNYLLNLKTQAFEKSNSQNCWMHHDVGKCNCFDKAWNIRGGGYYYLHENYKNDQRMPFFEWFKQNIRNDYPNPIWIYPNGIFAVTKERILSNPIEYYEKLLLEVNHQVNPAEGHFFERSWYYIFNIDKDKE